MSSFRAELLFRQNAHYLFARGWGRDGDDPGIWFREGNRWGHSLGNALILQLEADGVSMQEPVLPLNTPNEEKGETHE